MVDETTSIQNCGGKTEAMLAYGIVQISALIVSALSLAAISFGLCSIN